MPSRCALYLVTPIALSTGEMPLERFLPLLRAALDAGPIEALLLRAARSEGSGGEAALIAQIEALREAAHGRSLPLILEGRADLAARLGADGVHLPAEAATVAAVRRSLGADATIGAAAGASRHAAMEAGEAGADYVAFGFFDPAPQPPDLETVEWWAETMELPVVALGGITLANAPAYIAAGADFLALRQAVWTHPEGPAKAVKAFAALLAPKGKGRRA